MKTLFISILSVSFLCGQMVIAAETKPTAVVIKVEGTGSGTVKRKSRIETPLAIQLKMNEGDTLNTDANTTAEIALSDGTIIRVGKNSSYKITEVAKQNGFTTWAFSLLKGSIRALVEKSPDSKTVKFRTNTPVGTMGVRGTEFVVKYDEVTKEMKVYTIEGVVFAGKIGCEKQNDCATLKAGQTLKVNSGAKSSPSAFELTELVQGKTSSGVAEQAAQNDSVDLFADMKLAEKVRSGSLEPKDIQKMVKEASDLIQSTQDQMLGRTAQLRESMYKAIADGSYATKVRVAERFEDKVTDKPKSAQVREEEKSLGKLQTKKFAFGEAAFEEFADKNKQIQGAFNQLNTKDIDAVVERARKELRENRIAAQNLSQQAALTEEQVVKYKAIEELYVKAEELGTEVKSLNPTPTATGTGTVSQQASTQVANKGNGICYKMIEECTPVNKQLDPTCDSRGGAHCKMKTSMNCKPVQTNQKVPCPNDPGVCTTADNCRQRNSDNNGRRGGSGGGRSGDDDDDDDGFLSFLF